jgi:hypothetical protein
MKFVKKKGPAPFDLFMTSETGIPRDASLTYAPASETPSGFIRPDTLSVRLYDYDDITQTVTPISPAEQYGEITGFQDVQIPANAATDPNAWWNAFPKLKTQRLDNDTCSPIPGELRTAWTQRNTKNGAPMWQSIANRMVQCESLIPPFGAFNLPLEEEKKAVQEHTKENYTKVDLFANNQYAKLLKLYAEKAGVTGAPLFAFLQGPDAFLSYAKAVNAVPQDASKVPLKALALAVADSVMLLSAQDPTPNQKNFQNALYQLTRVHGENYGQQIDHMLSYFDKTLAQSQKDQFARKKAGLKMGGILFTPGSIAVKGKRASDTYSQGQARRDNTARGDAAAEEAGIDFDAWANSLLAANAKTITEAITDYLSCATPGQKIKRPLHADQYKRPSLEIVCGDDPNTWHLTGNGKALADALRAELSAQQGETGKAPPPPTDKTGSLLPWIIGGIGLTVAGPLGAAGGFALGKTLEKK